MGRKEQLKRGPEEKWEILQEGLKSGNIAEACRKHGVTCGEHPVFGYRRVAWNTVFLGAPNDAIVPGSSQLNNSYGFAAPGVIHSASLSKLGFTRPAELDAGSGIYSPVLKLLTAPVPHTS